MKRLTPILLVISLIMLASCYHYRYPKSLKDADSLCDVNPDSAISLLHKLRPQMQTESESVRMYYKLLTIKANDKAFIPHKTETVIMGLADYYEHGGDKSLLPTAYYYVGRVSADMKDAPRALDYFQRALDEMRENKNKALEGDIYCQMGYLYRYQDLYDDALKMFRKSYNNSVAMNDSINIVYDLSDVANIYMTKGQFRLALKVLKKSYNIAVKLKNTRPSGQVERYMALSYSCIGQKDLAQKYLQSSLQKLSPDETSQGYSAAATVYLKIGQNDSARYYYDKLKNDGSLYAKEDVYAFYTSEGLKQLKDKTILNNFVQYRGYIDSVRSITSTEAIAKATSLYNYQLREKENINLKAKESRMVVAIVITALIILVLLVLVFAIYQYNRHKRIQMQNQMEHLRQIKDSIYKKSTQFIDDNKRKIAELENMLVTIGEENNILKEKLENERNKLISENKIAEIESSERKIALGQLMKSDIYNKLQISSNNQNATNLTDDDWSELEKRIITIYPNFITHLSSMCKLSEHELRVCLLLKADVSPSRIALLTNHAETSISSTRRRLYEKTFKKKGSPKAWDEFLKTI